MTSQQPGEPLDRQPASQPLRLQGPAEGVTLVLGGGGARGLAHLGVLSALEAAHVPVHAIIGNSAGAIMAATWLQSGSAVLAIERVLSFMHSRAFQRLGLSFRPTRHDGVSAPTVLSRILSGWHRHVAMHLLFRRPSLFHRRRLEGLVHAAVQSANVEDLALPLYIVALDLKTGEEVVIDHGDLRQALTASASVAGFFPPVEFGGRTLIDAGLADNLPVMVALERAPRPVVAVNLSREVDERTDFKTGIELLLRSEELGSRFNNSQRAHSADVQISPRLGSRYWLDFSEPERVIAAGEEAGRAALPDILKRLPRHVASIHGTANGTARPT